MKQIVLTPAAGKRLIAKAVARHPAVRAAMTTGTLAIIAGTTNGYVAEEVLADTGQAEGFSRKGFRRGVVSPSDQELPAGPFPGDVVLVDGVWRRGKEIFDVVDGMKAGDVILKGANALDLCRGRAAVLIGHPMGGTVGALIPAVIGRRVKLLVPVGLEKRVDADVDALAARLNDPAAAGPRLMPLPSGEIVTELDAIRALTGATATLVAAGGVCGAEGAVWLAVDGEAARLDALGALLKTVAAEPPCVA